MKIKNLLSFFTSLSLCAFLIISCSKGDDDSHYISNLDNLIEQRGNLEQNKESRINSLRRQLNGSNSLEDKYHLNRAIYDEFYTYNSDSASKYIDRSLQLANELGNPDYIFSTKMKKAEFLTGTGLLHLSRAMLDSISHTEVPDKFKTEYYGNMIYLYSHLGNYAEGSVNDFYVVEREYKDSIMQVIKRDNPAYLWYKGLDVLGTNKPVDEIIAQLQEKLSNSEQLSSRQDAMDAYILAKLYQQVGDKKNYQKYMAVSAAIDVKTTNYGESSSLEELAQILFDEGDIDHAYKYINYCLNNAIHYPNRVKAYGISERLEKINIAYQDYRQKQSNTIKNSLIAICILAGILIAAITLIILQFKRLSRQSKNLKSANDTLNQNINELNETHLSLNEAHDQLKELVKELEEKNDELNEANYVKEEYIGSTFSICSGYIDKLAELKRIIHFQVLNKKYKEVISATEDFDMRDELKDFYNAFDTVFLHIYPDFVTDFNSLLEPDKQIIPKKGELLNTELRIYALIRLGITDSVKIADFLHCSTQTVYNNRFKVRNRAIIPKEEFVNTVRKLGSYRRAGT